MGVVLQMLKENVGWLGRLVLGATGVAWTIATFFVVPVLGRADRSGEAFH